MRLDEQQFCTIIAKSAPGFEPGLHRQNAVALPLEPPPLPEEMYSEKTAFTAGVEFMTC